MNGTTNVPTANSYIRIKRMTALTFGSSETNNGDIDAVADVDTTITARMSAGKGRTLMAIYTIPNAKTGYWIDGQAYMNKQGATVGAMADMQLNFRFNADQADSGWVVAWEGALSVEGSSAIKILNTLMSVIPAKTDIRVTALDVTDNNSDISSTFDIMLVDD